MALVPKLLLLASGLLGLVEGSAKVVPMSFNKQKRDGHDLARRAASLSVDLGNAFTNGLYFVNATVGTPGQNVALQIDTGSSDIWMFGPQSCDVQTSDCLGGNYDRKKSSSFNLIAESEFEIRYQTPGSGVVGDYFSDDFRLGGNTAKNITLAVATQAKSVSTGIMGIGFNTDESVVVNKGAQPYPNILDELVNQGLINTRAYSLYLDDLENDKGTVLFGGYDKAKYKGELTTLPIQPDAKSGIKNTMTVSWTSLSITDSTGTTLVTPQNFVQPVVLDSGATLTLLPPDLFTPLANYFTAVNNDNYGWLVPCNLTSVGGQVDYGFGGAFFSVGFDQLAIPLLDKAGAPLKFRDGGNACKFGISPVQEGGQLLFGDTFLRSQYVVYDLENQLISIAPTKFNVTDSQVVELAKNATVSAATTVSPPTAAQTATALEQPGLGTSSGAAASAQVTQTGARSFGAISGQKTTIAGLQPVGTALTTSSKALAAHARAGPFAGPALFDFAVLAGITGAFMAVGGALVAVF